MQLAIAGFGFLSGRQHEKRERLGLEQAGLVPNLDRGDGVVAGLEWHDQDIIRVG